MKTPQEVRESPDPSRGECQIFISGRGYMWIEKEKANVKKGDAIYVPPNLVHTAGNDEDKDLEFIWIKFH